jgi:hypothetical protein
MAKLINDQLQRSYDVTGYVCLRFVLSSAMSFRKSSVVIIDCGRRVARAGRGVGEELLPVPTIVSYSVIVHNSPCVLLDMLPGNSSTRGATQGRDAN